MMFPEHVSIMSFLEIRNMLAASGFTIITEGTSGFAGLSTSPFKFRSFLSKLILTIFGTMLNCPCGEAYHCLSVKNVRTPD